VKDHHGRVRIVESDAEWSRLTAPFLDLNYRQTSGYARASAEASGAACELCVVERGGEVIGAAAVRVKSVPVVGGGLAHVAGGPMVRREGAGDPTSAVSEVVAALEREFVGKRGCTLRVMAPLGSAEENERIGRALETRNYERAEWPRPYRTIAVDTTLDEEALRASFSKNWRKKLRRGETRGLSVRRATDDEAMADVERLHHELIERKGFSTAVDAGLLREAQRRLPDEQKMIAIVVEEGGEIAGMNLVSALGDTLTGIIGATTDRGAELAGAWLLEWEAMRLARERGLVRYDMGGYDPVGNEGVANFKNGTRGEELVAAGPLEKRASGVRPGIARLGERIYRLARSSGKGAAL